MTGFAHDFTVGILSDSCQKIEKEKNHISFILILSA